MTAEQLKQAKALVKQFFNCHVPGSFYVVEIVNDLEIYYMAEQLQEKKETVKS